MKRLVGSYFGPVRMLHKVTVRDASWLAYAVFAGLAARLLHLDRRPLWLDQAITYQRIRLGLNALIADRFINRHMPSYFLTLQAFAGLGTDGAWLRIRSTAFDAAPAPS